MASRRRKWSSTICGGTPTCFCATGGDNDVHTSDDDTNTTDDSDRPGAYTTESRTSNVSTSNTTRTSMGSTA